MTDLVLPAAAPIESYIDETVSVLGELMEDTPKDVLSGFDFSTTINVSRERGWPLRSIKLSSFYSLS